MKSVQAISFVVVGISLSFFAGCTPTPEMGLNLAGGSENVYKTVVETGKDYEYIQPSINKSLEKHSGNRIEMTFAQNIESLDNEGTATAVITIQSLKYFVTSPEGAVIDFDSEREADKKNALSKLIGQSYKIKIAKNGKVSILDASAIRKVVKKGSAMKNARTILSGDQIIKRHQVLALVDSAQGPVKVGDSWTSLASSPVGALKAKTFEKTYQVEQIKSEKGQQIAIISMNAIPSSKRLGDMPEDEPVVGVMAAMFDEQDSFTGRLIINLTNGQILEYNESLDTVWFAAESPEDQKSDKGPDRLTIGFTHVYSIEKID